MPAKADLHIHTKCSDGKLTPKEVIRLASEKKLSAVSITDHDTCDGYFKALPYAEAANIELIPGVEVTSNFNGREVHILAYYFDAQTDYFLNFLRSQKKSRTERIKGIISTLNESKIDVTYDEVWAVSEGANLGRPHIAKILIEKGYVENFNQAFEFYLSDEKLGEIDNSYPEAFEVIEKIKNVGGAAILAHPGRFLTKDEILEFIDDGKLDGIECIHPSHNWRKQLELTQLCEEKKLLKTGGSDFHGSYEQSGSQVGVITIAHKHVESMKRMTDQRKKTSLIKK